MGLKTANKEVLIMGKNDERVMETAVCGKPPRRKDLELIKNEAKVRELLGDKFHLNTELVSDGGGYKRKWSLYRRYDDFKVYMSEDNRKIMSSDTNTEEELLDFAKRHRIRSLDDSLYKTFMVYSLICIVLNIASIILNRFDLITPEFHHCLLAFVLGILVVIIPVDIIKAHIDIKNINIKCEEMKQYLIYDNLI